MTNIIGNRVRQWVRVDGVASLVSGVVLLEAAGRIGDWLDVTALSVRVIGVLCLVCGLDSLLVASVGDRRLPGALRLLAVGQEAAFVVALAVGLTDGVGAADAAMAVMTAGVAVVALLEWRAARSLLLFLDRAPLGADSGNRSDGPHYPGSATSPRSSGDRASVS